MKLIYFNWLKAVSVGNNPLLCWALVFINLHHFTSGVTVVLLLPLNLAGHTKLFCFKAVFC